MEENLEKVVGDTTEKWLEWKCVFCKQDLKESTPKLLPCFHSCCCTCLGSDEHAHGALKCPVCQQPFGHNDVIDNYFMREQNNESKAEENQTPTCTSCEDNAAATSFCTDCREWLCDACVQAHQRVRVTKDHVIRGKDETAAEEGHSATVGQRIAYCPVHKQEQLKLFCETCDVLTCRDCQLAAHRDHRYQFVSEACKLQKARIQSVATHLKDQKAKLEKAKEVTACVFKDLVEKEQAIREEIKQFAMLFISEIGQRSRQLVRDLHNICGHKKQEITSNNKEVMALIVKMEHSLGFVNDALEQGSDLALLYSKSVLLKQLMALQRRPSDLLTPCAPVDIKFAFEQQNLIGYIRQLGTLMIGDRLASSHGGGVVLHPSPKGHGHPSGVLRHGQPPSMNGLNHLLNMPPPYKAPTMNMNDSRMNLNSPSPTNPLVSSSSQSTFRQQNTHLWNLLEKPGPHAPNNLGAPFVKPSGTYVPPQGATAMRPILPRMPSVFNNGQNSALQKILMSNEPTSSSSSSTNSHNTHVPRNAVSIRPTVGNTGAQAAANSSQSSIVPNIIILPMGPSGTSAGTHLIQQQHSIPQYHHPQPHYHPPHQQQQQMVHAPGVVPQLAQGGNGHSANILLTSGTQRLRHFPLTNARGQMHPRPLVPGSTNPTVIVQPSASGLARPSTSGRPWVTSPHSTITTTESENSQDSNLKSGANFKAEKVSSSQRPSCGLMGITIKQEKPDDTDDICREMAANVYKELSQDSMDGLFASLRTETTKEAEAAGSSSSSSTSSKKKRAKTKQTDKVVQADSSSSPNTLLENSLDNVLSSTSAATSRPSSIGVSESSQQSGSNSSAKVSSAVKEIRLDDGNLSDASTEKAPSPKDSEFVDLTNGDTDESESHPSSPSMPKIVETRSLTDDPNEDWCAVCHDGGDLLCCSKCPKVYHLHCHVPALPYDSQEEDNWQCLMCTDVRGMAEEEKEKDKEEEEEEEAAAGSDDEEEREEKRAKKKKRKFQEEISGKTLKICERILLEMYCHELSPPFHEPVSKVDVPEYHKFIQKPMCFELIKSKLDPDGLNRYDNLTEFFEDLRLVFENCYIFNDKTSDVYAAATKVEKYLEEVLSKYFPDYEYKSAQSQQTTSAELKPRVKRRKQVFSDPPRPQSAPLFFHLKSRKINDQVPLSS